LSVESRYHLKLIPYCFAKRLLMDLLITLLDFFLHLDVHLGEIILNYGVWTYAILFLIIFMETGFVVTPFLPGDSLLFAAGTFAALGSLDPILLFFLLFGAAVLGDTINYWIGSVVGERAFEKDRRFLNREHLEKTQRFYEKHGGKTAAMTQLRKYEYLAPQHHDSVVLADLSASTAACAADLVYFGNWQPYFPVLIKLRLQEYVCVWRLNVAIKEHR